MKLLTMVAIYGPREFSYDINVNDVPIRIEIISTGSMDFDDPKVLPYGSMDFNNKKWFDDPKVFDDLTVNTNGSMDFDGWKVLDADISILDGLANSHQTILQYFHEIVF